MCYFFFVDFFPEELAFFLLGALASFLFLLFFALAASFLFLAFFASSLDFFNADSLLAAAFFRSRLMPVSVTITAFFSSSLVTAIGF